MIRLFLTDLDGTLFSEGSNRVKPEYFEIIPKLQEKGVVFGVSTGRQIANILRMFEPVKDEMVIIGENGACVLYRGEEIYCGPMSDADAKELIADTRSMPGCLCFHDTRHVSYVESEKMFRLVRDEFGYDAELVDDLMQVKEPCVKHTVFCEKKIDEVTSREFLPKWKDRIHAAGGGSKYLDCVALGSDKGSSVKRIQDLLHISPAETAAIGDNINDLGTLARAKYSFAVGNAKKEVKDACRFIAPDNNNDGVLRVLEDLAAHYNDGNLFHAFRKKGSSDDSSVLP